MIQLRYTKTNNLTHDQFQYLLMKLPEEMQSKVLRFRFEKDRNMSLISRILFMTELSSKFDFNWSDLKYSTTGKPYLDKAVFFNWSHSENVVAIGFSLSPIGVDIEKEKNIDWKSLIDYLHVKEQKAIINSLNPLKKFYEIWTRKEAYLKSIGSGLSNNMENMNCLPDELGSALVWSIGTTKVLNDYSLSHCTLAPITDVNLKEIHINELISALKDSNSNHQHTNQA